MKLLPSFNAAVLGLLLPFAPVLADVKLPAIISDHMVLKKGAKIPIWGTADPGEEVTVTLNTQTAKATADKSGKWKANLDLSESGPGPFQLIIKGKNSLAVSDVLVGEVWVASGQSNMEFTLNRALGSEQEIAQSSNPKLRQFLVKKATSDKPLEECAGTWVAASPETSGGFTAVGYYFAKTLQNTLKVPVGLIHTSWGGTPSEAWTPAEFLDKDKDLQAAATAQHAVEEENAKFAPGFLKDFPAWLKENSREDHPADASAFAGTDVSTDGWATVNLPGIPKEINASGAFWLRKTVPIKQIPDRLRIDMGAVNAFLSVYWNGKLVKSYGVKDYPGARTPETFDIMKQDVKEGDNVLAIRVFAPAGSASFSAEPKVPGPNPGTWLAKSEFELPALTEAQKASLPTLPPGLPQPQYQASKLYNAMVNPIIPYAITGVVWYQGESNAGRSWQYRTAFPLMIESWRSKWGQGVFPFYFVQLANFMAKTSTPGESGWAELRDAQLSTLKLPKTGQAVIIDVGDAGDIHPRNKQVPGERLAAIALANTYGKKVEFSGPIYKSMKAEDGKIVLNFPHVGGGLVAKPVPDTYVVKSATSETAPLTRNSPQSQLEGFAICGADHKWVWADAKIDGDSVVVWSDKVPQPVAVRYAWANNPTCNLYNTEGFPASPFRTDDFPAATAAAKYR